MNSKNIFTTLVLAAVAMVLAACHKDSASPQPDDASKITYSLKPFDGPLANPHKGFTVPTDGT